MISLSPYPSDRPQFPCWSIFSPLVLAALSFLFIITYFSAFFMPEAKAQNIKARESYTQALRFYRKSRRTEDKYKKLALLKKAEDLLLAIIDDYPTDDLSMKLVSGEKIGKNDWLTVIGNRIDRIEKYLNRTEKISTSKQSEHQKWLKIHRDFLKVNYDCLEKMSPECLVRLFTAKKKSLHDPFMYNFIINEQYFQNLVDLKRGDSTKLIAYLNNDRKIGMFMKKLVLENKVELATTLLMDMGKMGSRQHFKKRFQAKREVFWILRRHHKRKKIHPIDYVAQTNFCLSSHIQDEPDYIFNKNDPSRKLRDVTIKLGRSLCNITPFRKNLKDFLKVYSETKMKKIKNDQQTHHSFMKPYDLIPMLIAFGHIKEALYVAYSIPSGKYTVSGEKRLLADKNHISMIRELTEKHLIKLQENR